MKASLWNREYILFLVNNTITFLSFQILLPLVPLYGLQFTSSVSQIGILASAISLAALLIRPFSGLIADRYNCNRILALTQIGTAVIFFLYIITPNIGILIAMRFIQGLLFGINSTVIVAAGTRVMPEEQIGKGIGILTVTGIASQAIAPMIGLYIAENRGYPTLFVFTGLLAAASAVSILITRIGTSAPKPAVSEKKSLKLNDFFATEALWLALLAAMLAMATAVPQNFIAIVAKALSIPNIGLFFTFYAGTLIITRVAGSNLIDKYSVRRIIPPCAVMSAASLFAIGGAETFPPLLAAAALMGAGWGIVSPTILSNIIRAVPTERRGTASATCYFGNDIGFFLGPIIMGFIAEATNFHVGFYFFVIPTLAVIPLTLFFTRVNKKRSEI